jgi:type IV pilus assembly protein PilA
MLQKLIERRRQGSEKGFTLIELMVVVLIIAILIAIAIPTFLGARGRSQNRSAQSNLRNALTAEKTLFTDNDQYSNDITTALPGVEPSLVWVDGTAAIPATSGGKKNVVGIAVSTSVSTNDTVIVGAMADSGKCYYLKDASNGPGVSYGNAAQASTTTCPAANAGGVTFSTVQSTGWPS